MPRVSRPVSLGVKPYDRVTTSSPESLYADDIKPILPGLSSKTKTNKGKKGNGGDRKPRDMSTSRPWTTEELTLLFEHVSKYGASGSKVFDGAVPGRTANQAYQSWIQSLAPYIRKAIANKPGKGRA